MSVPLGILPFAYSCCLDENDVKLSFPLADEENLLLESNGKFITIGKTFDEKKWFGLFPVSAPSWFNYFADHKHSFHATVLSDTVYILTKDLEFIRFDQKTKCFIKSEPFKDEKWDFNDLILTSHQTNDDKVILVNKRSGKVHIFCVDEEEWIEKYCIMNVNFCSNSSGSSIAKLIAFTSTFLPMNVIEPLYEHSAD